MSSSFVDYYAVLGLDRCACEVEDESTPQEVDSKVCRSYRSKALTCHPDHAKGSIADVSLFHRVSDAYANLKDVNVRQNFKNNSPSAVKKPSTDICIMYESNSEAEMLNHLTDNRRLFLETTLYEYFRNNRFDPFKKTAQEAFANLLELSLYIEEAGGFIPIEGDGGDKSFEDFTETHPNFPCATPVAPFASMPTSAAVTSRARTSPLGSRGSPPSPRRGAS
jgi:curved DNA-binding protein CbpA